MAPLYVTNNSGADVNARSAAPSPTAAGRCRKPASSLPTAGPGERLAFAAYGPRTDIFVDRVLCRVLTP